MTMGKRRLRAGVVVCLLIEEQQAILAEAEIAAVAAGTDPMPGGAQRERQCRRQCVCVVALIFWHRRTQWASSCTNNVL